MKRMIYLIEELDQLSDIPDSDEGHGNVKTGSESAVRTEWKVKTVAQKNTHINVEVKRAYQTFPL